MAGWRLVRCLGSWLLLAACETCSSAVLAQAGRSVPRLVGWCLWDGMCQPKGLTRSSSVNFAVGRWLWHTRLLWERQALWMGSSIHHCETWLGGGGVRWQGAVPSVSRGRLGPCITHRCHILSGPFQPVPLGGIGGWHSMNQQILLQ